jgi:hypothetical protein
VAVNPPTILLLPPHLQSNSRPRRPSPSLQPPLPATAFVLRYGLHLAIFPLAVQRATPPIPSILFSLGLCVVGVGRRRCGGSGLLIDACLVAGSLRRCRAGVGAGPSMSGTSPVTSGSGRWRISSTRSAESVFLILPVNLTKKVLLWQYGFCLLPYPR